VAYGALIPASLLDRANWLNVHPSRLPRWRGAAPIERAIMAGDEESAVSVIRLVEELDAGPVGASRDLSIGGDTIAGDVYAEAARLAPDLIDEALAIDSFSPQVGEPTYAEKIGPADRELDWSRPAKELHDRIRALSPHIGARGEVEGRTVIVWRSRLDGDRLELLEVQPDGGTRMSYDAWLRGLRS
jgi:methionyl-tRNA formyltransferase